ncbi:hypothetical protein [Brunnivagina elsteri]|uniref:Uncharacterized protein n=1 Tax=Brunnivagina elsteri CCALA 953 TaxID=987040 RepID=A0A2A2TG61_9CYAN|nr:hypothetical protein [Calothrix elsteri]PAX52703.1 hypothetical protein CK510_17880 [Calothrix elsteri CCALA 953]
MFFSGLKSFLLLQSVVLFLVGLTFFGLGVVNSDNILVASADTVVSPEGVYYHGTPDESINKDINNNYDGNGVVENAKNSLKETADNVREKLNLDEPLPRSTKKFLKSTEERVEKAVEPVTGTRQGYYQLP